MQRPSALLNPNSKTKQKKQQKNKNKTKKTLTKNFLYFSPKKVFLIVFLIFWEMELSSPKIKKFLMFSQKKKKHFLIF